MQDKVILVNAGCGYDGTVKVREDIQTDASTQLVNQGEGIEIPVYSLNTIIQKFNITDAVLKVDCEGCEYDLFKIATNESLDRFNQIIIEYHYGYKELVKRLKEVNFKLKHTIPRHARRGMILGYIYAWK
nr:FkbM family methyltransferase [Sulfolobus islandicus]